MSQTLAQEIALLESLATAAPDFGPAMKAAIPILREDEKERFATETAPDGTPWAPLAASTVARKGHADILVETGSLEAAATSDAPGHVERVEGDSLVFGVDGVTDQGGIPWAGLHQGGGKNVPARPFVGVSDKAADKVAEAAADAEMEKWKQ